MNQKSLEKMKNLKFVGMTNAFKSMLESEQSNLTTDEVIALLIDSEWGYRQNKNINRRITDAKFRYKANVENIDFDVNRNLDRNIIMRYSGCSFIEKHEDILITGCTGIGKSYIASAIGQQACILNYRVFYANTGKLFTRLKMAKADGSYNKEINKIERQQLLILDDFGMSPFDSQSRTTLMEIIEDRNEKASTIITSQLPVKQWYDIIGDKTIADAILDRIVHAAHRIELKGESLRKKNAEKKLLNQNDLN
jgi:DNA replication protein DnaC